MLSRRIRKPVEICCRSSPSVWALVAKHVPPLRRLGRLRAPPSVPFAWEALVKKHKKRQNKTTALTDFIIKQNIEHRPVVSDAYPSFRPHLCSAYQPLLILRPFAVAVIVAVAAISRDVVSNYST